MGKKVYANGMEISHKAGDGKVIAAFPDVCLSPPSPPAGPIPIPYPNSSFAKDLKEGSSTVKIGGKPLALKGQSYFKSSPLGDEAATRSFGGSVVTHTITGKTYFQAHSMDVIVEGKNVCRHLDITTSNHASDPGSTPPMPELETMAQMEAFKKDEQWGHRRGPARFDCGGKHKWECNKPQCPDCWDPACEPNAKKTQEDYDESQSGTPQERAAKGKANLQKKIDGGDRDGGSEAEINAIDSLEPSKIRHVGYKAHCSACHMVADLDIVTEDAVIEVKRSSSGLKTDQMIERVGSVARACFPGKKLVVMTRDVQLKKLSQKLKEKEWRELGIEPASFPTKG